MKTAILLFLTCTFRNYSQQLPNWGLVYNYSIGDTLQYYNQGNVCCYSEVNKVILSKQISLTGDTVVYGIKSDIHTSMASMQAQTVTSIYNSNTTSIIYTNLNSAMSFMQPANSPSYYQKDTSVNNEQCGKQTVISQTLCSTNFECNQWRQKYTMGLGLTENYFYDYQSSVFTQGYLPQSSTLTYYHKIGEMPCGTNHINFITFLKKQSFIGVVNIWPNPVENELKIEGITNLNSILLSDLTGRKLEFIAENNIIDLAKICTGMYYLVSINGQTLQVPKKILKL